MKELKDTEISPEVEKSIQKVVDEDIQKIVEEEGEIEKSAPKLFGLSLTNIVGLNHLWKLRKKFDGDSD